jgi:hypothetical protein
MKKLSSLPAFITHLEIKQLRKCCAEHSYPKNKLVLALTQNIFGRKKESIQERS